MFDSDLVVLPLDLKDEFEIILASVNADRVMAEISCVQRVRMMAKQDPNSFYTLAAQTIVACKVNDYRKLEKYHKIYSFLEKAREVVDVNSSAEMTALKNVEKNVEDVVDIFDC